MWIIDQLVEQHIANATQKGEFENLPGHGKPLILDDDSGVPEELRVCYRLLKNSGYLPPELEQHREALELQQLMDTLCSDDEQYEHHLKRLALLELKLKQAGFNTDFLNSCYRDQIKSRVERTKDV